jgi:hypothetical protein
MTFQLSMTVHITSTGEADSQMAYYLYFAQGNNCNVMSI